MMRRPTINRQEKLGGRVAFEWRCYRNFRYLDAFKNPDELPQLQSIDLPFAPDERFLGGYENVPHSLDRLILFTTAALHLRANDEWRTVRYTDIEKVGWPKEDKSIAHTLPLHMNDGSELPLPVLGGTVLTRDLFSVMSVLDHVCSDLKRTEK
jgi:hypothetical protein